MRYSLMVEYGTTADLSLLAIPGCARNINIQDQFGTARVA